MNEYHFADKFGTVLAIIFAKSPAEAKTKLPESFQDRVYYIDEVITQKVTHEPTT